MGTAMGALGKVCALPVAALLVGAVTAGTSTNSTSLGNARISLSETGDVVVAWDSPAPPSGTTDVQPFVRYTLAGASSQSSNASKVRSWQGRIWSAAELKGLRKGPLTLISVAVLMERGLAQSKFYTFHQEGHLVS